MRRWLLLACWMTVALGCTPHSLRYAYVFDAQKPQLPPGLAIEARAVSDGISLSITNTSSDTARIIWERSALIDSSGTSQAVMISGQKYIDAGKTPPPTVVASRASASVTVIPASNVSYRAPISVGSYHSAGGWQTTPLLLSEARGSFDATDPTVRAYGGTSLRLLLYVEHPRLAKADVDISLTVAKIMRLYCVYVRGEFECLDHGEVYPTFQPPPPPPSRKKKNDDVPVASQ